MKAKVTRFGGTEIEITVEQAWFYEGKPERVLGYDEHGQSYKFKMDEEPFELGTGTLVRRVEATGG